MSEEYDVVVDVLTKHKKVLQDMVDRNLRSEFMGLNIMDDIRLDQISEINECIAMWKQHKESNNES